MTTLSRKRWLWSLAGTLCLVLSFIVFELMEVRSYLSQTKAEIEELKTFKSQFAEGTVEKTCPTSQYKTHYQCFRDLGKSIISRNWDSVGSVLLMSVAVEIVTHDRKSNRCSSSEECKINLAEISLDLTERQLVSGKQGLFTLSYMSHMKRMMQTDYATALLEKMDSMFPEKEDSLGLRTPASQTSSELRTGSLVTRYQKMRPSLLAYARKDAFYEFLIDVSRHF